MLLYSDLTYKIRGAIFKDYKQLMTYLKIANKKIGLLVNFNVDDMSDGIHRIAM